MHFAKVQISGLMCKYTEKNGLCDQKPKKIKKYMRTGVVSD